MLLHTHSVEETLALGRKIGHAARQLLQTQNPAQAICIALDGQLGAGKTQLARGIAEGANVADPSLVSSPTYVLMNIYEPAPGGTRVYHLDAYRIPTSDQFTELGIDEITDEAAIIVVEWAERMHAQLPSDRLHIQIEHENDSLTGDDTQHQIRTFDIIVQGPTSQKILQTLP